MSESTATLLVVDDDALNRDALSRRLIRSGYTVLTAESGGQAVDLVGAGRIDAVLLDVMMPGMSGLDTLRRLRETRSSADLPVIMVTARNRSDDVVEALDAGANDYVTKPIDFSVALARIKSQVSTRRVDPLTGLPNRSVFMDRLDRLIARGSDTGTHAFAVFFLDIDRFKLVNDSLGHLAGDELLVGVAKRLDRSLRATDTVCRFGVEPTLARLGGDEFTLLLDRVPGEAEAAAVAERLVAALAPPFLIQGREVFTSVSIGIVLSDSRYAQAEDMLRDADTAMYRAKAEGKARHALFDASMLEAVEERLLLEADLRRALERQELRLFYQPIVSLSSSRLLGFEALLRWERPNRGLVPPDSFIPVAEETGLIVPIGTWVLTEACRQMRAWDAAFPEYEPLLINVNMASRQFMDPDLVRIVADVLRETGLPAERLRLEVTESALLQNSAEMANVLGALRELGVQLGLDDFGTGYSALSYLQRFPFQMLKIDRSFVGGLDDRSNVEIIRAVIALAAGLSMSVTAEGIETAEQLEHLKGLACDSGQGFLFDRPLSPQDADVALMSGRWTSPAVKDRSS